jgi:tetratricopeptide (TPR) repeat protein
VFGYYFVMLSPALGFFWMTLQQQTLCADWWQYLAAPGIFAGIAALVTKTLHHATGKARLALHALVCIVLMMLAAQTWRRSETYQSLETYCRAVLAETPHLWTLQTDLGVALERQGRLEEAIGHHRAALRDNPRFVEAHNNLANCLREMGDLKAAEAEYLDALRLNHSNPEILANLADVYFQDGKINDALSADAQAIRADRLNFQRYFDFGLKLVANNQFEQGIICFRNALVLAPDDVTTQLALARALISVDQKAEAAAACDQALRNARKIGDEQLIQSVTLAAQSIQRR